MPILSYLKASKIPTTNQCHKVILQIAAYRFINKPAASISLIHTGIPDLHKPFWKKVNIKALYAIYQAQNATTSVVLQLLEDEEGKNQFQEKVLGYLRQFIGSLNPDDLRSFLRFTTGSSVAIGKKIKIIFNAEYGTTCRPIAHTCTPALELSSTHSTYPEFATEFKLCLASPQAWIMDSI